MKYWLTFSVLAFCVFVVVWSSAGWLVGWLLGCLFACLVAWWLGCLVAWLVGCLVMLREFLFTCVVVRRFAC